MSIWAGKWFSITMKNKGYYTGQGTLSNDGGEVRGYLKLESWDPTSRVLQGVFRQYDAQNNQLVSDPMSLQYASGTPAKFRFSSRGNGDFTYGFTGQIQAQGKNGAIENARLRTLAGYHMQPDQSAQEQSWVGWLSVSGRMIPESKVPAEILSP